MSAMKSYSCTEHRTVFCKHSYFHITTENVEPLNQPSDLTHNSYLASCPRSMNQRVHYITNDLDNRKRLLSGKELGGDATGHIAGNFNSLMCSITLKNTILKCCFRC